MKIVLFVPALAGRTPGVAPPEPENNEVEMHHIRALKEKVAGFMSVMRAMNRKQIPVCRACHLKIHNGTYDGLSLKDLQKK
jgi:predicted HNH restriction endonuclease